MAATAGHSTTKKLSATALTFNNGDKPHVGKMKGAKNRAECQKENQLLMAQALNRALKGQTGELEKKMFPGMTPYQRWAVLTSWMKYVLPTSIELSGQVGVQKIEVRYAKLPDKRIEAINDKKLDDYKLLNDE